MSRPDSASAHLVPSHSKVQPQLQQVLQPPQQRTLVARGDPGGERGPWRREAPDAGLALWVSALPAPRHPQTVVFSHFIQLFPVVLAGHPSSPTTLNGAGAQGAILVPQEEQGCWAHPPDSLLGNAAFPHQALESFSTEGPPGPAPGPM